MNNNTIKDGLATYRANLLVGAKKSYAKSACKALKAVGYDIDSVVWPEPENEAEAKWADNVKARITSIVLNRAKASEAKATRNPAQQVRDRIKAEAQAEADTMPEAAARSGCGTAKERERARNMALDFGFTANGAEMKVIRRALTAARQGRIG